MSDYQYIGTTRTHDGWFALELLRLRDNKRVVVRKARYRQLKRDGRIAPPAPSENSE